MTARAFHVAALVLAAACTSPAHGARGDGGPLVGVWTAQFELTEPLPFSTRSRLAVEGTVAMTANRSSHVQIDGLGIATHVGTYDVDFRTLGFDPEQNGSPTISAVTRGDSAVLEMGDANQTLVVMRGSVRRDSITGTWRVFEPRAGGAGRFLMTRRGQR
ncbi:MAG TPA: hypothetical protein VE967_07365 [Gemmatimonadaceae bacterium]|nr:hypothetical protein [Gemmatimonadaceae bacterium]